MTLDLTTQVYENPQIKTYTLFSFLYKHDT